MTAMCLNFLLLLLVLSAEAGEFTEVVKKIFLQGKPYTEENVFSHEA